VEVRVCMGTSCYLKGGQDLLHHLGRYVAEHQLQASVTPKATFCFEACDQGPNVEIDGEVLHHCTFENAVEALNKALESRRRAPAAT